MDDARTEPLASVSPSAPRPAARIPVGLPTIVIVDDDEISRRLIDATLERLCLVNPRWHAADGEAALEHLERSTRHEIPVPALIMLDGQMPRMSGLDVLRWIREQPALQAVPVVMLTGISDVETIRTAYDYGAASYLVKPVAFEALADVLRALESPWALL